MVGNSPIMYLVDPIPHRKFAACSAITYICQARKQERVNKNAQGCLSFDCIAVFFSQWFCHTKLYLLLYYMTASSLGKIVHLFFDLPS